MDVAPVFKPSKSKYLLITTDLLIPLFVIVSMVVLTYVLFFSPVFTITIVRCQLDYSPCDNSPVLAELDRLKGQNILRFNKPALSSRLTSADFTIRQADITLSLPNTLSVNLHSVYPVVALKLAEVSEWIIFDQQLRVIRTLTSDPNVPTVVVPGPITVTMGVTPADPALLTALRFARSLADRIPSVLAVTLVDKTTVDLTLPNTRHALLNLAGDLDTQLSSLQAILADDTIIGKASVIDMRFSQPVLR